MKKQKINLLLLYFFLVIILQLSFCFKTLQTQYSLNNRLNIKDDLLPIDLIDNPDAITNQILLIFVDGMRFDKLIDAETPNIDRLMINGTTFSEYHSVLPSFSRVNYAAFASGSSTNITTVFSNEYDENLSMPTLYSEAYRSGLTTGIVSDGKSWIRFLQNFTTVVYVDEDKDAVPNKDIYVKDAAVTTIENNFSQIQFIDFSTVDKAGHVYGAASIEYLETIELIDSYIGEIIDAYDNISQLDNTTIVLFSDHGHDDIGGHGGSDYNQTHASLVIANQGIKETGKIIDRRITMNYVTPTLLAMLGLPVAPTMNGEIIFDIINSTTQTKAMYSIQMAEIIAQQLDVSVSKLNLLSKKTKSLFESEIDIIQENISLAKTDYVLNQYSTSFEKGINTEIHARNTLSALYERYYSLTLLIRILTIIGIISILIISVYLLIKTGVIEIKHQDVFSNELIIPQVIGALSAISTVIIIFAVSNFNYNPNRFNSLTQALMPNLLALIFGILVVIFIPWLTLYLFQRKHTNYSTFSSWRNTFLRSSIGSIFYISIPIFAFVLYYIIKNGPWPVWFVPNQAEYFAYMIIGILSCIIYTFNIILILIIWLNENRLKLN
ncbi:MAG: sulfatase-like hydrolase/transferase [Asgard group archaeon]|nr:sulfatase-like hydrolase/transferase [Asgard group archaeon]